MNDFVRYQRGQVWDLSGQDVVIVSEDMYNLYEPKVMVVPLVDSEVKLPTHIIVNVMDRTVCAKCESLTLVDKDEFSNGNYIGVVGRVTLAEIEVGIGEYLGIRLYANGNRKPRSSNNKWDFEKFLEFQTDYSNGMSMYQLAIKYSLNEKSVMSTYKRLAEKYKDRRD